MGLTTYLIHALDSLPSRPWKNDAGTTRELAVGVGWRVSIAEVSSNCDFSVFERMMRTSVILCGGDLLLQSSQHVVNLLRHLPTQYSGDVQWRCTLLDEPAFVLNVMSDVSVAEAEVQLGPCIQFDAQQGDLVVIALDGPASVTSAGGEVQIAPNHFLTSRGLDNGNAGLRATAAPQTLLIAIRFSPSSLLMLS